MGMKSDIPEEDRRAINQHITETCALHKRMSDEDFMLILMEICKYAFILGQKNTIVQLGEELKQGVVVP